MAEQGYEVYFASCTEAGGIYHYRLQEDGSFTFLQKTDCDRPMYAVIRDGQIHVLLREVFPDRRESGYVSYELDENANLYRPAPLRGTKGICACHLTWFREKLYMTNYLSGSIFSSAGKLRIHHGNSIHPLRQETAHTHCVIPAPDDTCLMVTDLGCDRIVLYNETLELLSETSASPGAGPRHLVCMGQDFVACVNELECSVSVYRYQDKILQRLETLPLLEREVQEGDLGAAIRYRNGILYVSTRGADVISVFSWDGCHLKRKMIAGCGGSSPRDFFLAGKWLICTNEASSTVTRISLGEDGLPDGKAETVLEIPNVFCGVCM